VQTVFEAFMATASAAPARSFLCAPPAPGRAYHPDGIELTYGAVRDEVLRMKRAYEAAGYGHGHRVALLFENRPEFFFHYLALNALGASVVPVNPDYRHDELAYQMDHSDADLAVTISERVGSLEAVATERARPLPVGDAGARPGGRAGAGGGGGRRPRLAAAARCCAPEGRARPRQRGRAPLHLRHHRPAEGLRAEQLLLPERWRLVSPPRRTPHHRARARAVPEPAAALPHELPGGDRHLRDPDRELRG